MFFLSLVNAVQQYSSITEFVDGGGFSEALAAIGTNEYEAAKYAIQKMSGAHDKKAHVWSAITHLESAHIAFRSIHSPTSLGRTYLKRASMMEAAHLDVYTCCLMVMCYLYFKEEHLALVALNSAEAAWSRHKYFGSDDLRNTVAEWLSIFNPSEWQSIFSGTLVREADFMNFARSVREGRSIRGSLAEPLQ